MGAVARSRSVGCEVEECRVRGRGVSGARSRSAGCEVEERGRGVSGARSRSVGCEVEECGVRGRGVRGARSRSAGCEVEECQVVVTSVVNLLSSIVSLAIFAFNLTSCTC